MICAAALFVRGIGAVRVMLRQKGIQGADLDELSQEVFVRALESMPVTVGWLCETARRVAANHRRLHRHVFEVLDSDIVEEAPAPPEDRDARIDVRSTLLAVEDEDSDILVRHELLGEVLLEIAAGMRLSKSGAHVRLERARSRFRKRYG